MVQRIRADSLIAPKAKAASTRIFLVLVVGAVLALLSGCGGGSDEGSSTAANGAGSAGAAGPGTGSAQEASTTASQGQQGSNPSGSGSTPAGQANAKAKQGPGITPPKGPRERAATPQEEANATVADISLQSPSLGPATESTPALPAKYTCDGENTWPELGWSGVPAGTEELVLFAMALEPVGEALVFGWAVAGIDPSLEAIEEGKLPKGVILGRNSFGKEGYSICPEDEGETYVFALYALPKSLNPSIGFDPMTLRKAVLDASGSVGLLPVLYARG